MDVIIVINFILFSFVALNKATKKKEKGIWEREIERG